MRSAIRAGRSSTASSAATRATSRSATRSTCRRARSRAGSRAASASCASRWREDRERLARLVVEMKHHDEERLAALLQMLPAPPLGWVEAAQQLPAVRAAIDSIVARAEADAAY